MISECTGRPKVRCRVGEKPNLSFNGFIFLSLKIIFRLINLFFFLSIARKKKLIVGEELHKNCWLERWSIQARLDRWWKIGSLEFIIQFNVPVPQKVVLVHDVGLQSGSSAGLRPPPSSTFINHRQHHSLPSLPVPLSSKMFNVKNLHSSSFVFCVLFDFLEACGETKKCCAVFLPVQRLENSPKSTN